MNDDQRRYDLRSRVEVLPFVPADARAVLDVGCASGAFGAALHEARGGDVVIDGIEPRSSSGPPPAGIYRTVLIGTFPDVRPDERYDAIICNDVLEHMVDPWGAVVLLAEHLEPGGVVVASLPNMRYWKALWPLLKGRWDYADDGVLDRTHLRWFTKATMAELFTGAGYEVTTVASISRMPADAKWKVARILARRFIDDVLTKQYVVVARRPSG